MSVITMPLGHLDAVLLSISNQLSLSEDELRSVLMKMNEAKLTVVDLAEMSFEPATLCQYGVGNLGDAELILATVRKLHGGVSQRPLLSTTRQRSDSFDGLTGSEVLDIRTLSILLASVYNWESLGINLGLQMHQLKKIQHDCQGNLEMCKNRLFDLWLRQCVEPSWRDVVEALEQMEENSLANKIRRLFWQDFAGNADIRYSPVRQFSIAQSDSPSTSRNRTSESPIIGARKSTPHASSFDSEHCDPTPKVGLMVTVAIVTTTTTTPAQTLTCAPSPQPVACGPPAMSCIHPPPAPQHTVAGTSPPATTTTATDTAHSDPNLLDLLKSMTIDDPQQIEITCKIYNSDTNRLIESTPAPLTRDIKIRSRKQQRVQEFSSKAVPIGTNIRLEMSANCECYLYVINIGTSGKTSILLPNEYDPTNHFRANETYCFPDPECGFEIEGPPGKETLQILAFSRKQENLEELSNKPVQEKELYRDINVRRRKGVDKKGYALVQFDVQ